jgi:hypothetical protein
VTPPPAPALVIAGGIGWNYLRSRQGRTTISKWACTHKRVAVPVALAGGSWLTVHWWLYVVEG